MIQTSRLTLRPYAVHDLPAYLRMVQDDRVMRLLGSEALSEEDAWNRLLRYAGHWAVFEYGMFAVFDRDDGHFLGEMGIANFHRGLGDTFDGGGEAAWVFLPEAHGQGFAYEAAQAVHRWYASAAGGTRTVCLIAPENRSSPKLAQRLGYETFGAVTYRDGPFLMLERAGTPATSA